MAEQKARMNPGILAIWNDCAPGTAQQYEHWYRGEHLAERVGVTGFVSGWRYVAVEAQPNYFTHYVTESTDVLFSAAYEERMNNPTPLTAAIMSGVFLNCTRTICERVLRIGDARGAFALVARFVVAQDTDELTSKVQRLAAHDQVLRAEVWTASAQATQGSFAEVEIRGPDHSIAACVIVETTDEDSARALKPSLGTELGGVDQLGIY
ncbi:MAG: hypothetical protein ACI8W7_004660, partial [Gammaproteobacteria bacterium]